MRYCKEGSRKNILTLSPFVNTNICTVARHLQVMTQLSVFWNFKFVSLVLYSHLLQCVAIKYNWKKILVNALNIVKIPSLTGLLQHTKTVKGSEFNELNMPVSKVTDCGMGKWNIVPSAITDFFHHLIQEYYEYITIIVQYIVCEYYGVISN
jgi:hypothetical protein